MGFTGPEEAGNPDSIGTFIVVVGVQKGLKPLLDFFGQNIFFNLDAKAGFIISFDDPFNRALNWLVKNALKS